MSLLARFDAAALRPPAASTAIPPADLLAWCRADNSGFAWQSCDADLDSLDALMRELDGDRALLELPSGAARWRLRLGLKLREALGQRRNTDPWDAGHLRDVDALLHFEPRRPTLIVAEPHQQAARELLAARHLVFAHRVRLLLRA